MKAASSVEYGTVRPDEAGTVARLYLEAFGNPDGIFSSHPARAAALVADWMELMRRACGPSFIAARVKGTLAGFLLLLMPGTRLAPALLRGGFGFRLALRALSGRYGFPAGALGLAWRRLAGRTGSEWPPEARLLPHVDAILVRPEWAGQGIGRAMMERARQMSEPRYSGLSLLVEAENHGAIALYERLGFRVLHAAHRKQLMVWRFSTGLANSNAQPAQAQRAVSG